jgi:hypothetical protein
LEKFYSKRINKHEKKVEMKKLTFLEKTDFLSQTPIFKDEKQ